MPRSPRNPVNSQNRPDIVSPEATKAAGAWAASPRGTADKALIKRYARDPQHEIYAFVKEHPAKLKGRAIDLLSDWVGTKNRNPAVSVRMAKHLRLILLVIYLKDPALYTLLQYLLDKVEEKDSPNFRLSYVQIGTATGLDPDTVARCAATIEEMGWGRVTTGHFVREEGKKTAGIVHIEDTYRKQVKQASARWELYLPKMRDDLLHNLTPEGRFFLGLPDNWTYMAPATLDVKLDGLAEKVQGRMVASIGEEKCPVVHGTGINRQAWDLLHSFPKITCGHLQRIGFPRSTAYRVFKAAKAAIESTPAKVKVKAKKLAKKTDRLARRSVKYHGPFVSGVKAVFKVAAKQVSKIKPRLPFSPLPAPGPKPRPVHIEPPPQEYAPSSLPDLDANILL